jgi:hypothetical protein
VVEKLACVIHNREVSGSISARIPAILAQVFRGLTQYFQENAGIVPNIRPRLLPFTHFPINRSPIIVILRYIVWVTEKATLSKHIHSVVIAGPESKCSCTWERAQRYRLQKAEKGTSIHKHLFYDWKKMVLLRNVVTIFHLSLCLLP